MVGINIIYVGKEEYFSSQIFQIETFYFFVYMIQKALLERRVSLANVNAN